MKTPLGWRNISPARHMSADMAGVLHLVREIYPEAKQERIGDEVAAYWVNQSRLIGLAWKTRHNFSYVIMPRLAFDLGALCSVAPLNAERLCVLPCSYDDIETVHRLIRAYRDRPTREREIVG